MYGKTIRHPDNEDNKNCENNERGTIGGYDNGLLLYYMIDKISKIIQRSKDKSMTI
jgi:hypothetical protein